MAGPNGTTNGAATATTTAAPAPRSRAADIAQLKASLAVGAAESSAQAAVSHMSPLEESRLHYHPRLTPVLKGAFAVSEGPPTGAAFDEDKVEKLFPCLFGQPIVSLVPHRGEGTCEVGRMLRVGVVLSGGPAPGGHNVVSGLLDYLMARNADSKLLGFLGGPSGIIDSDYIDLNLDAVLPFRNQGGFHIIGSGRTKIETPEQFASARETVTKLALDGLVVVGGDDSNSNAMKLAEDFKKHGLSCSAIGVPKTLDADMRGDHIEMSFGFDTAVKVYANLVANLGQDAVSARKSYHFCRVMGRSASHIALECALQTRPNLAFIGEEVEQNGTTLPRVVQEIADVVCERADIGKNYGLIIIPEGLVEFMPDVEALIKELNEVLASTPIEKHTFDDCMIALSPESRNLFALLPQSFANQLMLERDPHGNVQVAKIEVERLLIEMVASECKSRKAAGLFSGKFSGSAHYLGYEGRCSLPTNFDANYCYGLGHVAAALIDAKRTGYVATLSGLTKDPEEWAPAGYPLTMMMNIERRKAHDVAVIKKKLVELDGEPFKLFAANRHSWRTSDQYRNPGPIQFSGPGADDVTLTMRAEAEAEAKTQ